MSTHQRCFGRFRPIWLLGLLLFLNSFGSVSAAAQIEVVSPSTNLWTESDAVDFDIGITDASHTCSLIDWSDSLVGWWRGEGDAADSGKGGNNGTLYGSTTYAAGQFGQAFSFGGSSDYATFGNALDVNKDQSFTVSAWVYMRSGTGVNIWSKGDVRLLWAASGQRCELWLGPINNHKMARASYTFSTGVWVHFAATYNSTTQAPQIYVNGASRSLYVETTDPWTDFANPSPWRIGHGRAGG